MAKEIENVEWARQQIKNAPLAFGLVGLILLLAWAALVLVPPTAPIANVAFVAVCVSCCVGSIDIYARILRAKCILRENGGK